MTVVELRALKLRIKPNFKPVNWRLITEAIFGNLMLVLTLLSSLLVVVIGLLLFQKCLPILETHSWAELLFSSSWFPLKGDFGFSPFILGTTWVTAIAAIIAVPTSLLTAIFLTEYSKKKMRTLMNPLLDLLAGIPSIVYGMWGVLIVVPSIKAFAATVFKISISGYSVLAAGIVLAVMIFPAIISVTLQVLTGVPVELRHASLALGATQWQTIKKVVLRKALPGVIAASILGVTRAFGETMAVLMVAGNVARAPHSVFDPAYPLPALIANNYGEMLSIPLYDSALLLGALILFLVVLFFNGLARLVLIRIEKRGF